MVILDIWASNNLLSLPKVHKWLHQIIDCLAQKVTESWLVYSFDLFTNGVSFCKLCQLLWLSYNFIDSLLAPFFRRLRHSFSIIRLSRKAVSNE